MSCCRALVPQLRLGGDILVDRPEIDRRVTRWLAEIGACTVSALLSAGCSTVPPLSHATNNFPFTKEIPIHDVVQRVKCELADALDKKTEDPRFKWMASWTVKADLTLQANETGSITPTMSFVQPLPNAYFMGAGPSSVAFPSGAPGSSVSATSQNFNFGLGATYSGQAYRTETLSFALSLDELKKWREGKAAKLDCAPAGVNDLQGNLDLAPWIESALGPVAAGDLELGIHPAPGTGAPKATAASKLSALKETIDPGQKAYYQAAAADSAKQATTSAETANASRRKALGSAILTQITKNRVSELAELASRQAIEAQKATVNTKQATTLEDLRTEAVTAAKNAEAAAQNAALAQKLTNPDPPIDSLSHSINFIATIGASSSPNWVLVHWKGPANLGNLASLSGIRTHTLSIALGSPAAVINTETARVLNNQAFRQAVQSP